MSTICMSYYSDYLFNIIDDTSGIINTETTGKKEGEKKKIKFTQNIKYF